VKLSCADEPSMVSPKEEIPPSVEYVPATQGVQTEEPANLLRHVSCRWIMPMLSQYDPTFSGVGAGGAGIAVERACPYVQGPSGIDRTFMDRPSAIAPPEE
jgi:hypothetical protein